MFKRTNNEISDDDDGKKFLLIRFCFISIRSCGRGFDKRELINLINYRTFYYSFYFIDIAILLEIQLSRSHKKFNNFVRYQLSLFLMLPNDRLKAIDDNFSNFCTRHLTTAECNSYSLELSVVFEEESQKFIRNVHINFTLNWEGVFIDLHGNFLLSIGKENSWVEITSWHLWLGSLECWEEGWMEKSTFRKS